MVKSNLENRTKTYIAGDLNTDKNLIVKLYEWNKTNNLNLSLVDDYGIIQESDSILCCNIKKSIREQLNLSKTFVLIIGKKLLQLEVEHVSFVLFTVIIWQNLIIAVREIS